MGIVYRSGGRGGQADSAGEARAGLGGRVRGGKRGEQRHPVQDVQGSTPTDPCPLSGRKVFGPATCNCLMHCRPESSAFGETAQPGLACRSAGIRSGTDAVRRARTVNDI